MGGADAHGARVLTSRNACIGPKVYSGIGEDAAADLLKTFFRERR